MRSFMRILTLLLLFGLVANTAAAAESKSVQTMAGILMKLNHFPTDADKEALKRVTDDKAATAQEKLIATILMNVQHKIRPEDKPKLEGLIKTPDAPASLKTLATILINLNHTASDAEKEKLEKLAS